MTLLEQPTELSRNFSDVLLTPTKIQRLSKMGMCMPELLIEISPFKFDLLEAALPCEFRFTDKQLFELGRRSLVVPRSWEWETKIIFVEKHDDPGN